MWQKIVGTLIVVLVLNFFLPRIMPGDPFNFISVEEGSVTVTLTEDQIAHYHAYYGMDKPMLEQFTTYISRTLRGDLGISIYYNRPVSEMIGERLIWTLLLVISALGISSLFGSALGLISAYHARESSILDDLLLRMMTILSEIPDFIIGLALLIYFGAHLKWFPLAGATTAFAVYDSAFDAFRDYVHHAALPCLTLSLSSIGDFYLLSRQSAVSVLTEPYILTARAKGLRKRRLIFHHVLANAISPILARIFMKMGGMLSGAVLVEVVFAYPGIGKLMREAVSMRDYVLIQGIFFYVAVLILIFNTAADMIFKKMKQRGFHEKL
ncbi:ABC transporter permease [Fusibacter paucivorans]|uniref:ABC transporter permease n=1 Tax=Fusibacter paucivorans TaxID=76009 RepID=A0ABS5PKZ7_9FIRM|nr:ABC transporter permease [Fusibacter paucivorans]MBS7525850.1 ABC transporter permease [Fusibacter paucivorans]